MQVFSVVLRDAAKTWFQGLSAEKKMGWETLKEAFLAKYFPDNTLKKLWQKLTFLHQEGIGTYAYYESQILKLWIEWEKKRLKSPKTFDIAKHDNVRLKSLNSFDKAKQLAKAKD